MEFRRGVTWHIGNVETLNNSGIYFRIGRTSKTQVAFFNVKERTFVDEEMESAPFTHVVVDCNLELCAIAKRTTVAASVTEVANRLARLLSETAIAKESNARLSLRIINDPNDFIEYIKNADRVIKFRVDFRRPNAFDVNTDFIKPMQECLENANGTKGSALLVGEDLRREPLEELSRSASAVGDDASVTIRSHEDGRTSTKHLRGTPLTINVAYDVDSPKDSKASMLTKLRDVYDRVRNAIL